MPGGVGASHWVVAGAGEMPGGRRDRLRDARVWQPRAPTTLAELQSSTSHEMGEET